MNHTVTNMNHQPTALGVCCYPRPVTAMDARWFATASSTYPFVFVGETLVPDDRKSWVWRWSEYSCYIIDMCIYIYTQNKWISYIIYNISILNMTCLYRSKEVWYELNMISYCMSGLARGIQQLDYHQLLSLGLKAYSCTATPPVQEIKPLLRDYGLWWFITPS